MIFGSGARTSDATWRRILPQPKCEPVKPSVPRSAVSKGISGSASIAVSAPGSFPDLVARAVFEKAGIPMGDVKFAAMGSDTDRYKALTAGVVQGAIVSNEYTPIATKAGVKLLVPGSEAVPSFVRICLHATGKTLKDRPDDAAKFLAYIRGPAGDLAFRHYGFTPSHEEPERVVH